VALGGGGSEGGRVGGEERRYASIKRTTPRPRGHLRGRCNRLLGLNPHDEMHTPGSGAVIADE